MEAENRHFRTFHEILIEQLQDQKFAVSYLKLAFEEYNEDKDIKALMDTIILVEEAQGGIFAVRKLIDKHFTKKTSKQPTASA